MPNLRLLADDLTGALDSAARFVPLVGPVPVLRPGDELPPTAAIDAGTRELDPPGAAAIVSQVAPLLRHADIAFKKIDSLLRGHVATELAACMRQFDHCVLAPAFPFQGRITRNGRQFLHGQDIGVDLPTELRVHGLDIPLLDAETDLDLDALVAAGRMLPGRMLWCGTGGLAGALACHRPVPCPNLPRPILALIGSDHAVAVTQLAAAKPRLHYIGDGTGEEHSALQRGLESGAAAACVTLPAGTPRPDAARRIGVRFSAALAALPRPGTLFVAGGETLRGLCDSLLVRWLEVDGELVPGVPISILRGGDWDGQRVVSKSGAFGGPDFLARLFAG
jgi:uncharacterized protein YgbK (DUF1537 family)